MADVICDRQGALGLITLNRPQALNALTRSMCLDMTAALRRWAGDPAVRAVAIRGAGGRAFCAGGDIRALYQAGRAGSDDGPAFYRDEYRLNRLIKRYPKPYVALVDGIVMGGGVGVSVHGSHRAVAEGTVFAMPETGIGLFPDVGGSYVLPRLPGRLGWWLGLTGSRLTGGDCVAAGIGTHLVASGRHHEVVERLAVGEGAQAVLDAVSTAPPPPTFDQDAVDRLFAGDRVETIVAALAGDPSSWAGQQTAILSQKSPTALAVTARQLARGRTLDFEACMVMEYRLASRLCRSPDFLEGVRAVVIDKDHAPRWRPAALAMVPPGLVEALFSPADHDLSFGEEEGVP